MISTKRAREIASSWYGGQWTALYKLVCNEKHDKLTVQDFSDAADEAFKEWQISRVANPSDSRSLLALVDYCNYKRLNAAYADGFAYGRKEKAREIRKALDID